MHFRLYTNAVEIKSGAGGHVKHTDFFCIGYRVHIARTIVYKNNEPESGLYEKDWHKPKVCDGSCRVWGDQNLDAPQNIVDQIHALSIASLMPKVLFDELWANRAVGTWAALPSHEPNIAPEHQPPLA